jgi:hypothetical protein
MPQHISMAIIKRTTAAITPPFQPKTGTINNPARGNKHIHTATATAITSDSKGKIPRMCFILATPETKSLANLFLSISYRNAYSKRKNAYAPIGIFAYPP